MMLLSQAAQVLGGRLIPCGPSTGLRTGFAQGRGQDVLFTSVSSDSRVIAPGDLFIALRGENFDGSEFVAVAAQSGAVAALVNAASYRGAEPPCPLLLVEDTRLALGRLAAHWRGQFTIPLVAVTGSNGKTTVKEMLASILRTHVERELAKPQAKQSQGGKKAATRHTVDGRRGANDEANAGIAQHVAWDAVLATQGNLNNDIGMPLMLLKLRATHRYAVIEMGMNHPGEIDYLTHLARPDVAVINNAASAHLAGLGSVEAVARAKGEIFAGLPENGVAVINADDAHAPLWRKLAGAHAVTEFGMERHVAVHAQWLPQGHGAHIEASTPQGGFSAKLQVPGVHNVRNALAATAAALALHIPLHDITAGLEKFPGVGSRLQRKAALHGAVLIDDSYNANPASVHAALKVLVQAAGKKILVLGDMGELGAAAVRLHGEIGAEARRLGVDELLALGELTAHTVQEFGAGARHFERIEDLLAALDKNLGAGSTVLVKGSRFMRMERVVQHCTMPQ